MSEIILTVKGYQFSHPKENVSASLFIQNAAKKSDFRLKAAANLFFATLFNLGNTAYYTTSTVWGTVTRFPTQGKKEAKNFLNAQGLKALNTAIYTATTVLLTIASLYDSKWALSHIEVKRPPRRGLPREEEVINPFEAKCPPRRDLPREEEVVNPFARGCNYDQDLLQALQATPEGQLDLLKEVFQHNLGSDDYSKALMLKCQGVFTQEQEHALPILKGLLARIIFVQDWETAPELQHVIPVITTELEAVKIDETIIKEKADKVALALEIRLANSQAAEEAKALREEQSREYQEGVEAGRLKAEQARLKEAQEEALGEIEAKLAQDLEGLEARLESFDGISADLIHNWQDTASKTHGLVVYNAKEMFRFVSNRLINIDLGAIDLSKVPEVALHEGLQETYSLADTTFFERITVAQETIQARITEINTLIGFAGLTVLKNAFPEGAEDAQKIEHGQLVLDHIAAFRQ
ncbi:hypothetical protein [Candidatus Neptunichlamydia sp. REUL1]|uniref:hypothetical protein n=1 Tax=Candidatus Neptunichlamydia sp. REUL1 TaxID=3064277 RepID=UPI002931AFA9|nr:hypothetical protein [Candidatus Neptunochlamydia sp. REUL1]